MSLFQTVPSGDSSADRTRPLADRMRPRTLEEFVGQEHLLGAGKPLRTAAYRRFPRPGMVIGDQVATDGILARRLGYAFVLFDPQPGGVPQGPRLMGAGGRLVRPLLFTRPD